jgi:hypothetical protein
MTKYFKLTLIDRYIEADTLAETMQILEDDLGEYVSIEEDK